MCVCVGGGIGRDRGTGETEREGGRERGGGKTPKNNNKNEKKQAWQLRGVSMSQPSTAPQCL